MYQFHTAAMESNENDKLALYTLYTKQVFTFTSELINVYMRKGVVSV